MSSALVIVLGILVVLLVVLAVAAARAQGPRWATTSASAQREAAMAAQADVEESDIEQMLEARNALRKRIGRPEIGEELAEEARREERD